MIYSIRLDLNRKTSCRLLVKEAILAFGLNKKLQITQKLLALGFLERVILHFYPFASIIDDPGNFWRKMLHAGCSILLAVITNLYHKSTACGSLWQRNQSSSISGFRYKLIYSWGIAIICLEDLKNRFFLRLGASCEE